MWKKVTILIFLLSFGLISFSQTKHVTYWGQVRSILDKHCTLCHFENGFSPFALTDYFSAQKRANFILNVVENRIMPPWAADTSYRCFINQNVLSKQEIETFRKWIQNGCEEGKRQEVKKNIVKAQPYTLDTTWTLPMVRPYTVKDLNKDIFKRFYVQTKFNRDVYASRFEWKPGNRNIVHHTEVFFDSIGMEIPDLRIAGNEQIPGQNYEGRIPGLTTYSYLTGWLPGELFEEFPKGICAKIPKGSSMFYLMHYAATPIEETDSTVFYIHESKSIKNARICKTIDVHGHRDLVKGSFYLPADSVITLHCKKVIKEKISAFSLLVHAHHLAQSMLAYVVTPAKDTIPLLHIPKWDFNWQFIYKFKKFEIIPSGSVIHYFVTYDNTSQNPENPHVPPKDTHYSFEADQEMMELFLYHVPYQEGDEKLPIEYPSD
ncbi:MAG: hypothetical protein K1X82_09435 [Bacteroidia bacterium]|nr:hypothetical protein [Bacteroidia bacterium]